MSIKLFLLSFFSEIEKEFFFLDEGIKALTSCENKKNIHKGKEDKEEVIK